MLSLTVVRIYYLVTNYQLLLRIELNWIEKKNSFLA